MVHDQVHDQAHISAMEIFQESLPILDGTIEIEDLFIVSNIVSHIGQGAVIHRCQPYDIHSEMLEVVQFAGDSVQISNSVTCAVLERVNVGLLNNPFTPPRPVVHGALCQGSCGNLEFRACVKTHPGLLPDSDNGFEERK